MKLFVLILVLFSAVHFSFAKSSQVFCKMAIADESLYAFSMKESQVKSDLSDHVAETIWPWKRRRGCHGGRKQKRRNKKRLKRSRA